MSYIKQLFYPGLNSTPKAGTADWNIYQLARAAKLKPATVKRYLSADYANIPVDEYKPIANRNGHFTRHYSDESALKFFKWLASCARSSSYLF